MTDENTRLTRRTALKGLGGAAALGLAGGTALLATGPAAAGGFDISETVSISTDDGSVEYVAVHGDSKVSWNGFDTEATYFDIVITLDVLDSNGNSLLDGGSPQQLHETGLRELSTDGDWGGSGESHSGPGTSGWIKQTVGLDSYGGTHDATTDWHIVGTDPDGYGLPNNPVDASVLNVGAGDDSESDTTESFTLVMESAYTWYASNDETDDIFSETLTTQIDVDVTNEGVEATATSGDGESGATGA